VLPDLAELSEDQMCRIELDSEVQEPESEALTDNQQHFSAPGVALNPLAPNPLDLDQVQPESVQPESVQPESVQPESQPLSAAASIPDLLEDPLTDLQSPDLQSEAVREAVREAVLPEAVPSQPRQPAPELLQSLLHSELEIPLANVAHLAAEAAPVHVEVPPVEVPPVPVEVPPAHLETPSEPVPPVLMPSYSVPVRAESAPMQVEPAPLDLPAPAEAEPLEPPQLQPEPQSTEISSPPGLSSRLNEAERIHHAVELVFDRFRPLLVAAIVRELARHN
jgi:hypothetical protein